MTDALGLGLGTAFALIDGLLVVRFVRHRGSNPWISLHLVVFFSFVVLFNLAAQVVVGLDYEPLPLLLVNALVCLYLALMAAMARRAGDRLGASGAQLLALDRVGDAHIAFWIMAWVAFKAYLYPRYGLYSFELLRMRDRIGASYWEASLNALLSCPALGAFLAFLHRATVRPRELAKLHLTGLCVVFFTLFGITNEVDGTRRFFAALMVWVMLGVREAHGLRLRLRPALVATVALLAALGFSEYFQRIRINLLLASTLSTSGQQLSDVIQYLNPDENDDVYTVENLRQRDNPFHLIYEVTEAQLETGAGTAGALTLQAVLDAFPAALVPAKEFVLHDEILGRTYDLEGDDVTAVPLLSLQSDFWLLGYLVAPLLYVGLAGLYGRALAGPGRRSGLLALSAAASVFLTVFRVEDGLETLVITLRNFLVLAALSALMAAARQRLRRPDPPSSA